MPTRDDINKFEVDKITQCIAAQATFHILSAELNTENYRLCRGLEQNLGDQKFIVDREVEAILTPWLIWEDRRFNQQEI